MAPLENVRTRLLELAERNGDSLAALSVMLGRNVAYLQQFVNRGTPKRLNEDDRLLLAQYFAVDERELGARDPWTPISDPRESMRALGQSGPARDEERLIREARL